MDMRTGLRPAITARLPDAFLGTNCQEALQAQTRLALTQNTV